MSRRTRTETSRLASLLVVALLSIVSCEAAAMACVTYVLVRFGPGKETKVVICLDTTIILALNALAKIIAATLQEWVSSNRSLPIGSPFKKTWKKEIGKKGNGKSKELSKKRSKATRPRKRKNVWQKTITYTQRVLAFHTKMIRTVHRISKLTKFVRDLLSR